jgi:hypothetical protein
MLYKIENTFELLINYCLFSKIFREITTSQSFIKKIVVFYCAKVLQNSEEGHFTEISIYSNIAKSKSQL